MFEIYFYRDKNGREPIVEYLRELGQRRDKDSRIKSDKINDYIQALQEYGTQIGEPYIRHLEGKLWELRPVRDRILFAAWNGDGFVLLHHFVKKTRKTPRREIARAKWNLADYQKRRTGDEGE